MAIWRYWREL